VKHGRSAFCFPLMTRQSLPASSRLVFFSTAPGSLARLLHVARSSRKPPNGLAELERHRWYGHRPIAVAGLAELAAGLRKRLVCLKTFVGVET